VVLQRFPISVTARVKKDRTHGYRTQTHTAREEKKRDGRREQDGRKGKKHEITTSSQRGVNNKIERSRRNKQIRQTDKLESDEASSKRKINQSRDQCFGIAIRGRRGGTTAVFFDEGDAKAQEKEENEHNPDIRLNEEKRREKSAKAGITNLERPKKEKKGQTVQTVQTAHTCNVPRSKRP
jgi:hypothetical protein